jgi:hypothetical protein
LEDCPNSSSMFHVCLVKRHHVHEDYVAFVHEKVAEEIKRLCFANPVPEVSAVVPQTGDNTAQTSMLTSWLS